MQVCKTYVAIIFFLCALVAQGQKNDSLAAVDTPPSLQKQRYDTNYIEKFPDHVAIEPWLAFPSFDLNFESKMDTTGNHKATYKPHLQNVLGVDVSYKAFSLSLGVKAPITPENEALYGHTKYTTFRVKLNTNPVIYEFYYNKFKGFADWKTPVYDTVRPDNDPFIKRNDISLQYTKLKATYIFSHKKFSYGAALSFTERQLQSRPTGLLVAHAYRLKADGDSAFLNPGQREFYGKYKEMNHLDVVSLGIGPGVAANFVEKDWFFSIGLYVMVDVQYHHAEQPGKIISQSWRAAALGDAFISFGYNSKNFYAGVVVRGDKTMVSLPFIQANTSFLTTLLSVGYRFLPPRIVPEIYDRTPLKYF